jgi:hypothetical protein
MSTKDCAMLTRLPSTAMRLVIAAFAIAAGTAAYAEAAFVPGNTQYIAALGDPAATTGTGAATWGFWSVDPGPRGVWIRDYDALIANAGIAPEGWQFDPAAWWLEEHGLMMESPAFPLPSGQYVVTGGRDVTSVLTITTDGTWTLADGATLYDVTHLGCRAAVYTAAKGQSCTPVKTNLNVFPMRPDIAMPAVEGCMKQDYQVLIVIGRMVEE